MKKALIIFNILAVIVCLQLMFSCTSDTPKFSRQTSGYQEYQDDDHSPWKIDSTWFWENVYVSNLPQDTLMRLKLILSYADRITLGFEIARNMKNLYCYHINFYEVKQTEDESFVSLLDPFVGGGTTIAVADKLSRKWIGIDQSVQAVKVTELRLGNQQDLFSAPFTVQLHKYDYDTLRFGNAFEFESWIVQQFGGVSNAKQRGDFGLDGKMPDNTPIQVKRNLQRSSESC